MNRVNRSRFSRIKQQYELKKMMAAYIGAEKQIMLNPGLTGWSDNPSVVDQVSEMKIITEFGTISPEDFFKSQQTLKQSNNDAERDIILKKAAFIKDQLEEAISNEEFERCGELEKVLNDLRKRYESLD